MHPDLVPYFVKPEARHALVLELWRADFTADQIARLVGYNEANAVNRVISVARGIGDKRAVYRPGYGARGQRHHYVRRMV